MLSERPGAESEPAIGSPARAHSSPWSPLGHRLFAVVWCAVLIGNLGTWIREVGAGWLMTTLTSSATAVAMVQVATTLPIFLLSLPAGALADIVNRRRMLLWVNAFMVLVMLTMAAVTHLGLMTPPVLLAGLLLAGVGTALMAPVQQSLVPMLVPPAELRPAIALNSLGVNVSRAIGPAVGGVILTAGGIAFNFLADALSYLVVIAAFWWWKGAAAPASSGSPEQLGSAMVAGLRFAWNAPPLRRVMLRAWSFFIFASAYWALLPVIAKQELNGGPAFYGLLLASVGTGAVLGAIALPALRERLSAEGVMRMGSGISVVVLILLATATHKAAAMAAMGLAGVAWIAVLTTANVTAQTNLPNWVRGRGLALYLTVFYGALTLGSFTWGLIADRFSVSASLFTAAALGCLSLWMGWRRPLPGGEPDLTPSMHWPDPPLSAEMMPCMEVDRGPVLVTVAYRVDPERTAAFLHALSRFSGERLRDGAYQWGVYEDISAKGHFVEQFLVPSWREHERQHHRVSRADADLQERVCEFHLGPGAPLVNHFIAPGRETASRPPA